MGNAAVELSEMKKLYFSLTLLKLNLVHFTSLVLLSLF